MSWDRRVCDFSGLMVRDCQDGICDCFSDGRMSRDEEAYFRQARAEADREAKAYVRQRIADTSVKEVRTMATTKLTPAGMVRDIAERVGWTFAQNFVIVLVATGSAGLYAHETWMKAFLVAAWAALFALVTSVVTALVAWHPGGYAAVFDRAARTFLQTFLGVMAVSTFTSFSDAGALAALATACSTAFLAALKSLVGLANQATFNDSTAVDNTPTHVKAA